MLHVMDCLSGTADPLASCLGGRGWSWTISTGRADMVGMISRSNQVLRPVDIGTGAAGQQLSDILLKSEVHGLWSASLCAGSSGGLH